MFATLKALGLVLTAKPAHADTFTVTNTNNSGQGSLGQALEAANANRGVDTITFNIMLRQIVDLPEVSGTSRSRSEWERRARRPDLKQGSDEQKGVSPED